MVGLFGRQVLLKRVGQQSEEDDEEQDGKGSMHQAHCSLARLGAPRIALTIAAASPSTTATAGATTSRSQPAPLFTHFWHWFELARMDTKPHPSPIRQGALLYNIFDSRNEGTATGVEEMFMHAGLYDDPPRSRELVWIMLAQRAARGLHRHQGPGYFNF